MKILILDNYDSFTFNLFQQVAKVSGFTPEVFYNDTISLKEILAKRYDCIIISPGPGRPEIEKDFGVCKDVILNYNKPILGVCLGHQGIGFLSHGQVVHAPEPFHGRLTSIKHTGVDLFKGLPQDFNVVRYHSLIVSDSLPNDLYKTAWTNDGIIMGIKHKVKPLWGIQFHPESISTEFGDDIIKNFLNLVKKETLNSNGLDNILNSKKYLSGFGKDYPLKQKFKILDERLKLDCSTAEIFNALYSNDDYSFWLDSSKVIDGVSRFSFIGNSDFGKYICYKCVDNYVTVIEQGGTTIEYMTIFDYLSKVLNQVSLINYELNYFPFDFIGGFVGFFGYELKSDLNYITTHKSSIYDAAFIFVRRFLAFDHLENIVYIVALYEESEYADSRTWIGDIKYRITNINSALIDHEKAVSDNIVSFNLNQTYHEYIESIMKCQKEIIDGESYEICLTNSFLSNISVNPLDLYNKLRFLNPAPYAAYLHFKEISILSSSPEQFLKVDSQRMVSSKPIKGTILRQMDIEKDKIAIQTLKESEKDLAENLMIVDLLRNDLGKVCQIGSVNVPVLMSIESYQTVHQLVSTITGILNLNANIIDLIKATFPGGSITGAPKIRSMEIINRLEKVARGPYTGSLGYLSFGGQAELNIIIRTALLVDDKIHIGAGGAITYLSNPNSEFKEILIKAYPILAAVAAVVNGKLDVPDVDISDYTNP